MAGQSAFKRKVNQLTDTAGQSAFRRNGGIGQPASRNGARKAPRPCSLQLQRKKSAEVKQPTFTAQRPKEDPLEGTGPLVRALRKRRWMSGREKRDAETNQRVTPPTRFFEVVQEVRVSERWENKKRD